VWIEFRNASKWQSECLFRNFFPSADSDVVISPEEACAVEATFADSRPRTPTEANVPNDTRFAPPPLELEYQTPLSPKRLAELAKEFAEAIPEDEFSIAALQGWLLKNKTRPEVAANGAAEWVKNERDMKERLAREREERERKERLDVSSFTLSSSSDHTELSIARAPSPRDFGKGREGENRT
jgi:chaperone BCS1